MKKSSFRKVMLGALFAASALTFASPMAFAAVTVNENLVSITREKTGQTAGNEVIFRTDPQRTTTIEVVPESAGSGTIAATMDNRTPTGFSNFSMDTNGATSIAKMINLGTGITSVGISITTGTWTTRVYNK